MIQFIEEINYYPQAFLEECKYIAKEKKMSNYIIDDINVFPDDYDREDFDSSDKASSNELVRCASTYQKRFSFIRKSLFQEVKVNLFILHLSLKYLLSR